MSIAPDHNGTLPEAHIAQRGAGRQQRQADARLIATPIPPIEQSLSTFRYWPLVAGVGLLALLIVVLFWPSSVGAAERRPVAEPVELTRVTGDAGWYVVKLADGRVLQVIPPRSRARVTPAPQVGAATLTSTTLIQDGYSYARVKR